MAAYKKTNALFALIHSLSRTEKRYFTVYASRHVIEDENKYVMLFDAINKQTEYDEAALRKLFAKEKFVKQLHQIKNYLYNLILTSLVQYNEDKTIEKRLRRLLSSIEILIDKGLYTQADNLIKIAKKNAELFDRPEYLLEIYRHERKVVELGVRGSNMSKGMQQLIEENKKAFERYTAENDFWEVSSSALGLLRTEGFASNKYMKAKYESSMKQLSVLSTSERSGYRAINYYYDAQTIYFAATGQLDKALEYAEKIIKLHENNWIQVEEKPQRYAASVNNFLILAGMKNDIPLIEKGVLKLKNLNDFVSQNNDIADSTKSEIYATYFLYRLKLLVLRGEFSKIIQMQSNFSEEFKTIHYKTSYPKILTIYFYFSLACLAEGKLTEASKWINKVIDEDISKYPSIIIHAKILCMAVHYEREHYELVESLIKSHQYYLKKRSADTDFDKMIVRHFKILTKPGSQKNKLKLFEDFRKDLTNNLDREELKNRSAYFDIISWIKSKETGRMLSEFYKEKIS